MAQGYVQILNLRESNTPSKDTSAVNNLGGAGIANDLRLFSNNLLNETVILASTYTVDANNYVILDTISNSFNKIEASTYTVDANNFVLLDTNIYDAAFDNGRKVSHKNKTLTVVDSNGIDTFRLQEDVIGSGGSISQVIITPDPLFDITRTEIYQIPLSNRTKVTHNEETLTVVDSNGSDRFRLKDSTGTIITPNVLYDIVRNDTVRHDNIKNLINSGITTDQTATVLSDEGSISVSESSIAVNTGTNTRFSLESLFSRVDETIDRYRFDRTFAIVTDTPQSFDRRVRYRSTITVTNDDAISLPTSPGDEDNAPGIFIAAGTDAQRAFSNNNNPWSGTVPGSGYMLTPASKATISTLILTDPDFESLSTATVLPSDVVQDYTHKIEVIVNGETYYILCSDN